MQNNHTIVFMFNGLGERKFRLARPLRIPLPEAGTRSDATPAPKQIKPPTQPFDAVVLRGSSDQWAVSSDQ